MSKRSIANSVRATIEARRTFTLVYSRGYYLCEEASQVGNVNIPQEDIHISVLEMLLRINYSRTVEPLCECAPHEQRVHVNSERESQ